MRYNIFLNLNLRSSNPPYARIYKKMHEYYVKGSHILTPNVFPYVFYQIFNFKMAVLSQPIKIKSVGSHIIIKRP